MTISIKVSPSGFGVVGADQGFVVVGVGGDVGPLSWVGGLAGPRGLVTKFGFAMAFGFATMVGSVSMVMGRMAD